MRSGERGYALLLAIAVVAVLAFTALASSRALGDVVTSTTRLREGQNEIVAAESALSHIAFLVLTEDVGPRHLMTDDARMDGQSVRLDGAWYHVQGVRGASISVQDEAGLFNLNSTDQQALAALLAMGERQDASSLAATLMDYTDADDLTRDEGAEARDYAGADLPPPADKPLSSRWQALEAMGWDAGMARSDVWAWLNAGPAETALNINTAPAPVLEAVLGDRRRAEMIIRQRESSPLTDMAQVEALTGGTARADGAILAVAPALGFRVQAVFGSRGPRHGIERRLELGGADDARPFRWLEEREVRLAPLRDGEAVSTLSLNAPAS